MCGTPVLAPRAPPFTETVLDQKTGYLYRDPREDGAAAFDALISSLKTKSRINPETEAAHLERFAYPAFAARVRRLLQALREG
jgi:glycosyltransferase involved in cell wall biosynthesis